MRRQVPVVALTGYLGAGKTTLLNRLLLQPGARVGVIVNDFGAIDVDAGLVTGQVGDVASIAGGCICCIEDASGLDAALAQLTHPRLGLDVVLVEASGIAEPVALARLIRFSTVATVRPAGVVEVVDAQHYFETVDDGWRPPSRFAAATLVVLNKADLLPVGERDATLDRIEARVREVNPDVHVVRTSRGSLDPALVFDAASTTDPEDELPLAALLRADRVDRHDRHDHHDHPHASAASATSPGPVHPDALVDLLESPPSGAYRLKGTVAVGDRGYVVHVVGRQVHVARTPVPGASTLVAIGDGLDVGAARAALERALAPSADPPDSRRLERLRRLSV